MVKSVIARRAATAVTLALVGALALLPSPATAQDPAPPTVEQRQAAGSPGQVPAIRDSSEGTMPRRYSDIADLAVGVDECSKPLEDREGAWVCPRSDVSTMAASCSFLGCWSYEYSYQTRFVGDGVYGFEGTILGYTDFQIRLRYSGGSSRSYPFTFRSTRGTESVGCSGEGIYFSAAHPEGNGIYGGDSFRVWNTGSRPADSTVYCFGSNGYSVNHGGVTWSGVAYQVQWTDPSSRYGGTWWIWVKSPKFREQSSGAYKSTNPPTMGTDWYGSGWSPY